MVWTNSWPSIVGADCGLICVGAGEEWVQKVYALRGLRGVERQLGLTRDPGASRSFDAGGRVAGSQGLRREDEVCGDGVAVR
jgi:hypothetical protein